MSEYPYGWTPEQAEQRYVEYTAKKHARGLEPRSREAWLDATRTWGQQRERGDEFRDLAWHELDAASPDWRKERSYTVPGLGRRRYDIDHQPTGGRRGLAQRARGTRYEFKAGGGGKDELMGQLAKDDRMAAAGHRVVWVCLDARRMPADVQREMRRLSEKHPGFQSVDLSSTASLQQFARQHPREAAAFERAATTFRAADAARAAPAHGTTPAVAAATRRAQAAGKHVAGPAGRRSTSRPGAARGR